MIQGLSHLTFIVADLDRTETLFTQVFGARRIYDSGEKSFSLSKERFFLIGDLWIATMEGVPLSTRTYRHTAFKIEEADYARCLAAIGSLGLQVEEGRTRLPGEARSIYFYDWDNHLFELHTGTLHERLAEYGKEPVLE